MEDIKDPAKVEVSDDTDAAAPVVSLTTAPENSPPPAPVQYTWSAPGKPCLKKCVVRDHCIAFAATLDKTVRELYEPWRRAAYPGGCFVEVTDGEISQVLWNSNITSDQIPSWRDYRFLCCPYTVGQFVASSAMSSGQNVLSILNRRSLAILGGDDRVRVASSRLDDIPWSWSVRIVYYPNADGSFGVCSGLLNSARTVLTAAHCLYDDGAWLNVAGVMSAEAAEVFTGFGSTERIIEAISERKIARWTRMRVRGGWVASSSWHDDVGFVEIYERSSGFPTSSYMSSGYAGCQSYGHTFGFPGDKS